MNLVVTMDDLTHSIADSFGVTLDSAGDETNYVVRADHPIFAGPFGRISQFRGAGNFGHFRGWSANAVLLASSSTGPSVLLIPRGILAATAGAVLLTSDVDQLTTYERQLAANNSEPSVPVTDALVMNIIAFLCNPDISSSAPHLVFPQFANGQSTISSMNLTNAGTTTVSADIAFRDDNGSPFSVNIVGQGFTTGFSTSIGANQTVNFMTDGTGLLRTGTATVRGSPTLAGNIIYHVPGLGVTSVGASEVAGGFVLPIVQQPAAGGAIDVYTGVGIRNLSAKTANLRLEIWDPVSGRRGDGTRTLTVPGYGHIARFLFELYPGFNFTGFRGSLRVVSLDGLISVIALQLGSTAGQLTAIPIKPQYR